MRKINVGDTLSILIDPDRTPLRSRVVRKRLEAAYKAYGIARDSASVRVQVAHLIAMEQLIVAAMLDLRPSATGEVVMVELAKCLVIVQEQRAARTEPEPEELFA
jgi:hypothetical protein